MSASPRTVVRVAAALALSVVVSALPAHAEEPDPGPPTSLEAVVARLGVETESFDGGALWGISVLNLDTGEQVDFEGDQWLKAASSLKMTWLAAAIRESGVEAVEPYSELVMVWSNNESAGKAMELAGGIDGVNAYTSGLGMNGTLVVEWTSGTDQRSKYYPGEHPWLNYTTADDLVTFWHWLYRGQALDPAGTRTLLEWGRLPKHGILASLIARMPPDAANWTSYKMGVLPPGRTEDDEEGNPVVVEGERDAILGSGVVEVPGGPTYVIAVAGFGGWSWWGKVSFIEYASCRIYEVVADDPIGCDRPEDPERTRLDTDPPLGGLASVAGTGEFISVRGWASDPDEPLGTIITRFTVDGAWHGAARADGRHSWGADPMVPPGRGFESTILALLEPGEHEVCAWAINDGSGRDTAIGCRALTVR